MVHHRRHRVGLHCHTVQGQRPGATFHHHHQRGGNMGRTVLEQMPGVMFHALTGLPVPATLRGAAARSHGGSPQLHDAWGPLSSAARGWSLLVLLI
mmetsp:Transcript_52412/g.86918  ORF Transcript_52412/g.86918 Transcript_52412/m.86918 type:complete len:96 (-) Transcript_52412:7-294(-)